MNKYFLLLIASFASLSLNAAEGQGYCNKLDQLIFLEKGGVAGGTQSGARILAHQEWYIFEKKDGSHYFVQHKEGGVDLVTGKDSGVNGTVVMIRKPDGKEISFQNRYPKLSNFSFFETYKYLNFCKNNTARFPVVAATK